jgi:tetratricopeptide (TPR) repeat protein
LSYDKKDLFYGQFIWFTCCGQADCPKDINTLPMYGHVKKCKEQLDSDKDFLTQCDKEFKNRKEAAQFHVDKGWEYFYKNQFETAMKRFNQAWLLDSLNADIFWGYGNILGMKNRDFKQSLVFLEQSLKINANILESGRVHRRVTDNCFTKPKTKHYWPSQLSI